VTFLSDLIDDASGTDVPLSQLLRRIKVLAVRTKSPDLAAWAQHEIDGYPGHSGLPTYRGPLETQVLADFLGPMGSYRRGVALAGVHVPERLRRDSMFSLYVLQGVAQLEHILTHGTIQLPWPPEAVLLVQQHVARSKLRLVAGMNVDSIYRTLAPWTVKGILDTVRGRLLDLALEVEQLAPNLMVDVSAAISEQITPAQVQNVYNTVVMSGAVAAVGDNASVTIQAEAMADGIVQQLTQAADVEPDPDKKGLIRRSAEFLGGEGRGLVLEIVKTEIKRHIPGMQ
jgi:hypothetical protein